MIFGGYTKIWIACFLLNTKKQNFLLLIHGYLLYKKERTWIYTSAPSKHLHYIYENNYCKSRKAK